MYRIELRPGQETSYQTFDEFAAAVQGGTVSASARVWHGASSKWLPITVHPHYKRALSAPAKPAPAPVAPASVAPAPVTPAPVAPAPHAVEAPVAKKGELEFLEVPELLPHAPRAVSGSLFGPPAATPKHIEALVAAAGSAPAPVAAAETGAGEEILIDISRPRPTWLNRRTAAVAGGVLVVASAVAVIMTHAPSSQRASDATDSTATVSSTSLAATPNSSFEVTAPPDTSSGDTAGRVTEPTSYMPMPAIPDGPSQAAIESTSTRVLPAAPRLGRLDASEAPSTSSSAAALANRYNSAHDAAQASLENRLRASGITALFSDGRLTSASVSDTRLAVSGIANFIRTYRTQSSAIEAAYRDTAGQFADGWTDSQAAGWYKGMTRGESQAAVRSADQLLEDVSSLLGVLEEQAGAYTLASGKITFRDAGATLRYGTLRRRIADRLASADSASAVISSLRKVIGPARPPVESFSE